MGLLGRQGRQLFLFFPRSHPRTAHHRDLPAVLPAGRLHGGGQCPLALQLHCGLDLPIHSSKCHPGAPEAQNTQAVNREPFQEREPSPLPQVGLGAYSFIIFAMICVLTTIYTFLVVPETKSKTFIEINEIFTKMNKMSEVHPEKEELKDFPPSTAGQ